MISAKSVSTDSSGMPHDSRLTELPCQGVFSAAVADEKHSDASHFSQLWTEPVFLGAVGVPKDGRYVPQEVVP
ncbi:hypothetical protein E4U45_000455 [Claviceps purpurea]|nr:hypothetical protein E4U45_000455 [Claviceps purpurea]